MKKIVFVCSGNTCRSPMAMAFFNNLAASAQQEFGFEAVSAGLSVSRETLPSKNAVQVMQDEWAIDISGHRAHSLTQREVEEAHLLLTMELSHKQRILSDYPGMRSKVFTLKEYSDGTSGNTSSVNRYGASWDIRDPYGQSVQIYSLCAREIKNAVESVVEKLKKS